MQSRDQELRSKIRDMVGEYYRAKFVAEPFEPGTSHVHYAGRVFDEKELQAATDAVLDFWLSAGRFTEEFEASFAEHVGSENAFLVNSGSSANLLALTALMSPLLGERRLAPGDEVITAAAGFPTTLNPIIQNGMVPVLVDIDIGTYNIDADLLEASISPKTKAIFLAHTLGNPFDVDAVMGVVKRHNLWLLEDCCDALGSAYRGKMVGSFGNVATCSFYPAHHITMGEGGCVFTGNDLIARALRSIRDWGRDCYCAGGENNTCGKRFTGEFGSLPRGYDHKYVFSHVGYNLKATDIQAAIGVEQLKKLPEFIRRRKQNFALWMERFSPLEEFFVLPRATEGSDPSWFAFPLTVREGCGFSRTEITNHLSSRFVETRNLFGGNLLRQPAYENIRHRVARGGLVRTDRAMNDSFFSRRVSRTHRRKNRLFNDSHF